MSLRGLVVGDRILQQAADSHADWCAGYGRLGPYSFVGASAIGKLHVRDRRPRDDAFTIRTAGSWLAVAVSDGAGSRKQSRYGASFASEALCEQMLRAVAGVLPATPSAGDTSATASQTTGTAVCDKTGKRGRSWFRRLFRKRKKCAAESLAKGLSPSFDKAADGEPADDNIGPACGTLTWCQQLPPSSSTPPSGTPDLRECVRQAFQQTRSGLEAFANTRNCPLPELHCTLLGILLNTETGALGVGHIGDGFVMALSRNGEARPLVEAPTPPDAGEVYLITQKDWEKYFEVRAYTPEETKDITTFYLMTDGVADDCHPPPPDIRSRWAKDIDRQLRQQKSLQETATRLLRWLATYDAQGSWDDRTLVVVMRDPEGGETVA